MCTRAQLQSRSRPRACASASAVCASALRLPEEPVRAAGHPVADREVALLLADPDQRLQQVGGPARRDRHQQRDLGLVDVPHGADVEGERPRRRPPRALVVGEAGLDQRVVERGGEHLAAGRRAALHLDPVEVVGPAGAGRGSRMRSKAGSASPHSRRRFSQACSQPRSEKPIRTSTVWPARAGPMNSSPNGRSVVVPDPVEVEPGATLDQPPVVPEHLPPAGAGDLDGHRERHALQHHRALRPAEAEVLHVGPQRNRLAVLERQPAAGQVQHHPRAAALRERVAVHGDLLADRDLAADTAGVAGWRRSSRPRPSRRAGPRPRPGRPGAAPSA